MHVSAPLHESPTNAPGTESLVHACVRACGACARGACVRARVRLVRCAVRAVLCVRVVRVVRVVHACVGARRASRAYVRACMRAYVGDRGDSVWESG
jgi:hypothetical protein